MKKDSRKNEKTLFGIVKVSSKGQIIIPVDLRNELGIRDGDQLYILKNKNNDIVLVSLEKMEKMINQYGILSSIDI